MGWDWLPVTCRLYILPARMCCSLTFRIIVVLKMLNIEAGTHGRVWLNACQQRQFPAFVRSTSVIAIEEFLRLSTSLLLCTGMHWTLKLLFTRTPPSTNVLSPNNFGWDQTRDLTCHPQSIITALWAMPFPIHCPGAMSELAESNALQVKELEGEKRACKIEMLKLEVRGVIVWVAEGSPLNRCLASSV